jgi:hypothetical protein
MNLSPFGSSQNLSVYEEVSGFVRLKPEDGKLKSAASEENIENVQGPIVKIDGLGNRVQVGQAGWVGMDGGRDR